MKGRLKKKTFEVTTKFGIPNTPGDVNPILTKRGDLDSLI